MTTWMKQTNLKNETYQINETLFMNEINYKHVMGIFDWPFTKKKKKKKKGFIKLWTVPK
jgi:hypothetical protein